MAPVSTLIVDDDADLRRLACLVFEHSEQCLAVLGEVASGPEALVVLEGCSPDVVVLDLTMPGWDGFETARAIRDRHPEQPIVLWSANLTPRARRTAQAQGIAACVQKGDLRHLADVIRSVGRPRNSGVDQGR